MTVIRNKVTKADGSPQDDISVEVSLTWDHSIAPIIIDPANDVSFYGTVYLDTDSDGVWSVDVIGNDVLTPGATPGASLYKIIEKEGDVQIALYYVIVTDDVGPTWVGDILQPAPDWEES
jgi:hypothetical protein